jgi:hypothetical protein
MVWFAINSRRIQEREAGVDGKAGRYILQLNTSAVRLQCHGAALEISCSRPSLANLALEHSNPAHSRNSVANLPAKYGVPPT